MIIGVIAFLFIIIVTLSLCNIAGRESKWEDMWQDADDGYGCHENK